MEFHSTWIKKLYSRLFETNGLSQVPTNTSRTIVPIIELEPEEVAFSGNANSSSVFVCPTDKDFYLTSADVNSYTIVGEGPAWLEFTKEDGTTFIVSANATPDIGGYAHLSTSKAGIRLKKGSAVSFTLTSDVDGIWNFVGYYGSDRS